MPLAVGRVEVKQLRREVSKNQFSTALVVREAFIATGWAVYRCNSRQNKVKPT